MCQVTPNLKCAITQDSHTGEISVSPWKVETANSQHRRTQSDRLADT